MGHVRDTVPLFLPHSSSQAPRAIQGIEPVYYATHAHAHFPNLEQQINQILLCCLHHSSRLAFRCTLRELHYINQHVQCLAHGTLSLLGPDEIYRVQLHMQRLDPLLV